VKTVDLLDNLVLDLQTRIATGRADSRTVRHSIHWLLILPLFISYPEIDNMSVTISLPDDKTPRDICTVIVISMYR
jgi:hypothetical protein